MRIARADRAYFVYRYGTAVLRAMPRSVARSLMAGVGTCSYYVAPGPRATVRANLRRVVGHDAGPTDLDRLVRRSFVSYARYWADLATLPALARRGFDAHVAVDEFRAFARRYGPTGAVVALPHLGSWEIAGAWAHANGFRVHAVAEPSPSERLTRWFDEQRHAFGIEVYELSARATGELLRALGRNEFVTLIADRDVVGDGIEVEFFGGVVRLPSGPAMLALRSGKPLVPAAIYSGDDDYHVPFFLDDIPPTRRGRLRDDVARMTQELARAFEVFIRRSPEQWHVFQPMWADATT